MWTNNGNWPAICNLIGQFQAMWTAGMMKTNNGNWPANIQLLYLLLPVSGLLSLIRVCEDELIQVFFYTVKMVYCYDNSAFTSVSTNSSAISSSYGKFYISSFILFLVKVVTTS